MTHRRFLFACALATALPVAVQTFLACSNLQQGQRPASARHFAASTKPAESWQAATQMRDNGSGERVASEDPEIWSFHGLGEVNGVNNLYRSASPIRDIVKQEKLTPESPAAYEIALARLRRMYDKGIRTIVSFESPASAEDKDAWIALEKKAAANAGLQFVSCPLANSGPNSFETLPADAIEKLLDHATETILADAKSGGVLMHCSAGHDRTGMVVAYLRIRYQHWTADKAIEEMRFYGHNWPKYSANGGASSWHEEDLRKIASLLH